MGQPDRCLHHMVQRPQAAVKQQEWRLSGGRRSAAVLADTELRPAAERPSSELVSLSGVLPMQAKPHLGELQCWLQGLARAVAGGVAP